MSCLGSDCINEFINNGVIMGGERALISPASIDFRLSKHLLCLPLNTTIDAKDISNLPWEEIEIPEDGFIMIPSKLYLGSTIESLKLPSNIVATAEGKSTIGRLGLTVHVTAGWIDPGFDGSVTLEMVSTNPIRIYEGMRIGQFTFLDLIGNTAVYEGRYQKRQFGLPTPPKNGGLFYSSKNCLASQDSEA
jgi:deoxycytidine triphosphate deaminase